MGLFVNVRELSVRELMDLARSNEYSVAYTPFGRFGLRTYIRRAAPWKGLKGDAFWDEASKHGRLADGLRSAIDISKRSAGNTGVALVKYMDGSYGIMPYKSALQGQGKTIADIIATAPNYFRLITRPEASELIKAAKLQPVVY